MLMVAVIKWMLSWYASLTVQVTPSRRPRQSNTPVVSCINTYTYIYLHVHVCVDGIFIQYLIGDVLEQDEKSQVFSIRRISPVIYVRVRSALCPSP